MIIGNGLLAQAFLAYQKNKDVLIFASGVSNSKENNTEPFQRETKLLLDSISLHKEKKIVYFSTCSVEDASQKDNLYIKHKIKVEQLIQQKANNYQIFRLSNIFGKTNNPYTIINYFINSIKNKQSIDIWGKAYRNIIDVDDVFKISDYILKDTIKYPPIINIANPISYNVLDIYKKIENFLCLKGDYKIINKGAEINIDLQYINPITKTLNINFDEQYFLKLLKKYSNP